jgi:polysaccharide biosynthesis/export protein
MAMRKMIMLHRLLLLIALMAGVVLPAHAQSVDESYRLGVGDSVEVAVLGQTEAPVRTRIDSAGNIVLPLIGRVAVAGETLEAAATRIEQRYIAGKFLLQPIVRLDVVAYESQKVSVIGQVNAQGLLALDRRYSLTEIIARAGGLTADAAERAIITRRSAAGTASQQTVDLAQLLGSGGAIAPLVEAGDVIYVPRAPTFSVVGAVNKAGLFRLMPGMTVQQALATAGDVARIGTTGDLKVRRPGATPAITSIGLDDPVREGDVIIVKERVF